MSGGQTGADRGALDAAMQAGVPHGGWCPRGRLAEDGAIPPRYLLQETSSPRYPVRTEQNVVDSDGTALITYGPPGGGSALTARLAHKHARPLLCIDLQTDSHGEAAAAIRRFVERHEIRVLNVAGSRESNNPGLADAVRGMMLDVLTTAR